MAYNLFNGYDLNLNRLIGTEGPKHSAVDNLEKLCRLSVLDSMDDENVGPIDLNGDAHSDTSSSSGHEHLNQPLLVDYPNGDQFYSDDGCMPAVTTQASPGFQDFVLPMRPVNRRNNGFHSNNSQSSSMSDIANQSNGNYGNHSNGNYSNQSNGNFANQSNGNYANHSNGNLQTVGSVLGAIQELLQNSDPDALIEPGLLNPQRRMRFEEKYCALCKKNGETREFYTTHVLKDNRGKVICPILRKYSCPKCGATGDNAHTLRHCPITRGTDQQSVMETIKTPRSSCGRRF